ncbi:Rid family hydrolase [Undibacterium sp. JH2W]|uniref:Rid family hydrolase n=1 Tax=Undibacterium sp. JH2W TaxID=3413037 RepID=UPI003BF0C707
MPYRLLLALAFAALSLPASAETTTVTGTSITRTGPDTSIVSNAIWVGDHLHLSGKIAAPGKLAGKPDAKPAITGDTRAQTISTLQAIQSSLRQQGLDMVDVVQMRVYLVGDPALGGKMDFAGLNHAYRLFFGTTTQANKPVRTTVQVAALALPEALVEIEVMAVRSGKQCTPGQLPCHAAGPSGNPATNPAAKPAASPIVSQAVSRIIMRSQAGACRQQAQPDCHHVKQFAGAARTKPILL